MGRVVGGDAMTDLRKRAKESREAAQVLREMLAGAPLTASSRDTIHKATARRRNALELAISILEARAFDGDNDE